MIKRKSGFTLVELIIVMGILGLALAAMSSTLLGLLKQQRQQSKISESNIEGIIGLELLRQDIERAGCGLPWVIPSGTTYQEASSATAYNDSPGNPPRQIISGNNNDSSGWIDSGSGIAHSDYLVIKATTITRNGASQRWSYLSTSLTTTIKSWSTTTIPTSDDPRTGDYVIVLSQATGNNMRSLVTGTPVRYTSVSSISAYLPPPTEVLPRLVYGIDDSDGRMPFNRADYYVLGPSDTNVPSACAPNTGVLVKSVISQKDGSKSDIVPLLDCVADMELVYRLDTDGNGILDATTDDISTLSPQQIRTQLKEVRVYILAHEGQRDPSYTYPANQIYVGDPGIGSGKSYNLGANLNYRWKLYTIAVKPKNL